MRRADRPDTRKRLTRRPVLDKENSRVAGDTQPDVKRFFWVPGCAFRLPFRVEGLSGFDHSADDGGESVGDASGGAGVLVSAAPQRVAIRPAGFVAPDGGHGPAAGGVPGPRVRGESSPDHDGLSGSLRDGRDAEVASRGVQVGPPDAVEGFGKDDGRDGGADAGDGPQDVDGLPAFPLLDSIADLLDLVPDVLDFGVESFELSDNPSGGVGDGLDGSRRGRDGFAAKGGRDAFGGGSGAASPEHGLDGGRSHAAGLLRRRGEDPEVEGPGPVEVRSGLQEGRGSSA